MLRMLYTSGPWLSKSCSSLNSVFNFYADVNVHIESTSTCQYNMYPHHITCHTIFSFTVQDGRSPLYRASQEGHRDIVHLLLQAGADVHHIDNVLLLACFVAKVTCLKFIIYSLKKSCSEGCHTSTVYMQHMY